MDIDIAVDDVGFAAGDFLEELFPGKHPSWSGRQCGEQSVFGEGECQRLLKEKDLVALLIDRDRSNGAPTAAPRGCARGVPLG